MKPYYQNEDCIVNRFAQRYYKESLWPWVTYQDKHKKPPVEMIQPAGALLRVGFCIV